MGRPAPVFGLMVLLLAVLVLATACGGADVRGELDPAAARAVARHVDAAQPGHALVVLDRVGGAGGAELPWGVRQSLTTAGIQLGDSTALADAGTRLLVFEGGSRSNGDIFVDTRVLLHGAAPVSTSWRVQCTDAACEVVDSLPRQP